MEQIDPPHNLGAEQSLLGALMLHPAVMDRITDIVNEDDFYLSHHRMIWRAILDCIESDTPIDLITIADQLEAGDRLEQVGGTAYLGKLQAGMPAAANAPAYAEIIAKHATMRRLMSASADIMSMATRGGTDPQEAAEEAERAILRVLDGQAEQSETVPYGKAVSDAQEWLLHQHERGIPTGFESLDKLLRGMHAGQLILLAGRPGHGKSALALSIAEHVAASRPAVLFSLEMGRAQLAARSLRWHTERLSDRQAAVRMMSDLRLHINDGSNLSLGALRLKLRRMKRKYPDLSLVVIDYLGLMQTRRAENRNHEVAELSRGLKVLAGEMGVAILALHQLNRAPEARTDKRPIAADLRDSGSLEQDADCVLMVYRDYEYSRDEQWARIAEVLVRKNREGPTGTVYLGWNPDCARMVPFRGELPAPDPANVTRLRRSGANPFHRGGEK